MHGKLIDEVGYHCRDYFLKQWDRFQDVPGRHPRPLDPREGPRDATTPRPASRRPRIRVTLATGIPRERCERIDLGYLDPASVDVEAWKKDPDTLVVPRAGEMLYRADPSRARVRSDPTRETPRMKYGLDIRPGGRPRLRVARRPRPPPRPRHHPVPQGHRVRDPRERRRVQLRREPGRLLPHEDRHRHRHGRLPHRRADRRARAGDGRHALLQALRPRRRARAEHGHRLLRPRPRRARPGRLLQPLERGRGPAQGRATSTGRRSSRAACAGSTAAASSPRSPRRRPRSSSRA